MLLRGASKMEYYYFLGWDVTQSTITWPNAAGQIIDKYGAIGRMVTGRGTKLHGENIPVPLCSPQVP
jgi:hypothetical protein